MPSEALRPRHCFEAFAEKTACILDFDEVQDFCRACVGRRRVCLRGCAENLLGHDRWQGGA